MVASIEQLVRARASNGIRSQLVLAEPTTAEFESAAEARQQLLRSVDTLEQAGDRIESLLIIGGPAIIPFELAPNPTKYDGDSAVPSDHVFGTHSPTALVPEWPVGRLPGAEAFESNSQLLIGFIQQAARLHTQRGGNRFAKVFSYSTAAWREASALVSAELGSAPLLSPPTVAPTLERRALDGASAVYCNLHGVRDGAIWYGQDQSSDNYLVALRADDVLRVNLNGALVLSEACYGAVVAGRDERSSMALAFLRRGAACFVGATAMAYGPATTPLSEADLIALHFWRAVAAGGTTIGAAFLEARARMLLETLSRQPALDDDDRKTALEFVLYGDPTLAV